MGADASVFGFLGGWLGQRALEPPIKVVAARLQRHAGLLSRGEAAGRFASALARRLSGIKPLLEGLDAEPPAPAPATPQRLPWNRLSRRVADRWDLSAWASTTLKLSAEKNPIVLAAVSQALEESAEGAGVADLLADLRKLRSFDEREYRSLPVPPGPRAPWDLAAYLLPSAAREPLARVAGLLEGAGCADATAIAEAVELARLLGEGWPIARERVRASLATLDALAGDVPGLGPALAVARRLVPPSTAPMPDPTPGLDPEPDDSPIGRARRRLAELAGSLGAEPSADARSFGRRLGEVLGLVAASTPDGLARELTTVLASLDDPISAIPPARWRPRALEAIARVGQDLGGGEVLDARLVGQPLDAWTGFVAVVGHGDDGPPAPGQPLRIDRVDRVGYRVTFPDGETRALVRAHVRTAR